jgi:hypothetical protein
VKVISACENWVNIDAEDQWLTYNYKSGQKTLVSKQSWPTYGLSLTMYKRFLPLDPPLEISSLDDLDQETVSRIQEQIQRYAATY